MNPSVTLACVEHLGDIFVKHAAASTEEPDYSQAVRNIAKRQALTTAKEIGSIALPMVAGVGAGMGYEKFMKNRGGAAGGARKLLALSALPAVGIASGLAYSGARRLKENEFARIRDEEMGAYDQKMRDYRAAQKAQS